MQLVPPLTMMAFFRKSEGTWLTHRTVHHFDGIADEAGESRLQVTVLEPTDPQIQEVCSQQGIDGAIAAGGASFLWQPHKPDSTSDPAQAAILVDLPDDETGRSGKLLRNKGYVEQIPVISRYWFGQDGILTIDTDYEANQGQERCWFVTDQFRVRVSSVRMMNGVYIMTYCSERRCVSEADLDAMLQRHSTEIT